MKKVLYITFNEILGNTGGSLGQKKIYLSLKRMKVEGKIEFDVVSLDKTIDESLFALKKSRFSDIYSRICGHSNFLFNYLRRIIKYLKKNKYDILLLGNSRLGFIAKKAHKYVNKIITHFDNIEYDYAMNRMSGNKIVQKIELSHVFRDEKASIFHSNILLFLSKRDENRAIELYKINFTSSFLFPVCLETEGEELPLCDKPSVLFTGSLNYEPNIESVRKSIALTSSIKGAKLIVGGSSPSDELRHLCEDNNIETHFNFSFLKEFAHKGDIVLIPSDHGAGMKVKVADAMKNGLLVIGTKETFVGYEKAFQTTKGLIICEKDEEFSDKLKELLCLRPNEIENLANSNINAFKRNFSIEKAFEIMEELI